MDEYEDEVDDGLIDTQEEIDRVIADVSAFAESGDLSSFDSYYENAPKRDLVEWAVGYVGWIDQIDRLFGNVDGEIDEEIFTGILDGDQIEAFRFLTGDGKFLSIANYDVYRLVDYFVKDGGEDILDFLISRVLNAEGRRYFFESLLRENLGSQVIPRLLELGINPNDLRDLISPLYSIPPGDRTEEELSNLLLFLENGYNVTPFDNRRIGSYLDLLDTSNIEQARLRSIMAYLRSSEPEDPSRRPIPPELRLKILLYRELMLLCETPTIPPMIVGPASTRADLRSASAAYPRYATSTTTTTTSTSSTSMRPTELRSSIRAMNENQRVSMLRVLARYVGIRNPSTQRRLLCAEIDESIQS